MCDIGNYRAGCRSRLRQFVTNRIMTLCNMTIIVAGWQHRGRGNPWPCSMAMPQRAGQASFPGSSLVRGLPAAANLAGFEPKRWSKANYCIAGCCRFNDFLRRRKAGQAQTWNGQQAPFVIAVETGKYKPVSTWLRCPPLDHPASENAGVVRKSEGVKPGAFRRGRTRHSGAAPPQEGRPPRG